MNRNSRKILCAIYFWGISLLVACGSNVTIPDQDKKSFTQTIYVEPEGENSVVHLFHTKKDTTYLELNESVKIQAVYSLDEKELDRDIATNYYENVLWTIGNQKYNIPSLRLYFTEPGAHQCILQTTNLFGDVMTDTMTILVSTPESIKLTEPREGYDQLNILSSENLDLRWKVSGIDPWETTVCSVFASTQKANLWTSKLGTIACDEEVSLHGPFIDSSSLSKAELEDYLSYTNTFYWGVIMNVKYDNGNSKDVYSNIFSFSSQADYSGYASITVPFYLEKFDNTIHDSPNIFMVITDAQGDTLETYSHVTANIFPIYIEPQSGINIYMEDLNYTEYGSKHITFDATKNATIVTDTIVLKDNTAPTLWPTYATLRKIQFAILDNGSGIDKSSIVAILNDRDTLNYEAGQTWLNINFSSQLNENSITVYAKDYAGNSSSKLTWKISEDEGSVDLSGPFIRTEYLE